jgi:hypothetical protein
MSGGHMSGISGLSSVIAPGTDLIHFFLATGRA